MATYTKEPSTCESEILFIGTTGLRHPTVHPDTVEMYIDVVAPDHWSTTYFEEVSLYIEVLTAGVKLAPGAADGNATIGEWSVWEGGDWVVKEPGRPPTDRLRLRRFKERVTGGGINGLTIYLSVTGLPEAGALELNAYCDAIYAVADTKSCRIHMQDFHVGQKLTGFLGRTPA
ncbi:hypothetical protein [Streptomyces sp. CB01881]|uniref:hypothetical protein n=1 Tax=Streptomyces sp. CB01881 TaxID=2078691 RepID=UPI000CDC64D6|nr:hypothetical protein [Streptomyces sp. CB01881]AUY50666.1 hypothetical protein C2142_18875 [Streptomyces sp. CB01881]TYC74053.1 hypothetical protein EH183_18845 [Streptomyces sp. CB01881]